MLIKIYILILIRLTSMPKASKLIKSHPSFPMARITTKWSPHKLCCCCSSPPRWQWEQWSCPWYRRCSCSRSCWGERARMSWSSSSCFRWEHGKVETFRGTPPTAFQNDVMTCDVFKTTFRPRCVTIGFERKTEKSLKLKKCAADGFVKNDL